MAYIFITIIISIFVIILIHIIINKCDLNEYLKHIPENDYSLTISAFILISIFIAFILFISLDLIKGIWLQILGCLCLFSIIISFSISKLILALYYKKVNYSFEYLDIKNKKQRINDQKKKYKRKVLLSTLSNINEEKNHSIDDKLEKEMDYNYLNDYEKELVRKGDYDPTNFEYPENEEELGDDDFYSDDEDY